MIILFFLGVRKLGCSHGSAQASILKQAIGLLFHDTASSTGGWGGQKYEEVQISLDEFPNRTCFSFFKPTRLDVISMCPVFVFYRGVCSCCCRLDSGVGWLLVWLRNFYLVLTLLVNGNSRFQLGLMGSCSGSLTISVFSFNGVACQEMQGLALLCRFG